MKFGNLVRISANEFKTINGRIRITFSVRKEHMHVKFSGAYRLAGLTNIKALNSIEKCILANRLIVALDAEGYLTVAELDNLNYAAVFSSCFSVSARKEVSGE